MRTELGDNEEPLPDDVLDSGKYIEIPHKNDPGLGKPLALKFAVRGLPDYFDEIAGIFQRRGAYGRFKFENRSEREALCEWCVANGIQIEG